MSRSLIVQILKSRSLFTKNEAIVQRASTISRSSAIVPRMPPTDATLAETAESITIVDGGDSVLVTRGGRSRRIPVRWLRLLCSDAESGASVSGQRSFNSVDLPSIVKVRSAVHDEEQQCWRLRFEGETTDVITEIDHLLAPVTNEDLDGSEPSPFSSADPQVRGIDYETLEAPTALRSFLETLFRRGYARIRNVPSRPGEITRVARLLGLRGELAGADLFEEVAEGPGPRGKASHDDAPHTDEPYRDPLPGYLLQHCLEASGSGGETFVIDGMSAAATLAAEEPLAAVELTRWPVVFRYQDAKVDHQQALTLLETAADGSLRRITFNDRAVRDFRCPDDRLPICASAYDSLARILQREGLQHRFRMQPGDLLITNNLRVLHGRHPLAAGGTRRLACCYLETGDLLSTWRRARSGAID